MNQNLESYFSISYEQSKKRWFQEVTRLKAQISSFPISAKSPEGKDLAIDFAIIGDPSSRKVILHVAGTHGIEGFLGAAIQLAILKDLAQPPKDFALALLHCLNPWGMSHLRRVTEDNVDLNRNFQFTENSYQGAPEGYRLLDGFLNPKREPAHFDKLLFYPQAILAVLKFGFANVKQAIAGGQSEYQKGLFFTGKAKTENLKIFENWLKDNLSQATPVFGIEVHSGLGPYGYDTLFTQLAKSDPEFTKLESNLGHPLSSDAADESVGFKTIGDLANAIPRVLSPIPCNWILQEFGTYNNFAALSSFRIENMYHHYGNGDLNHWSKCRLMEIFNPKDINWRREVVSRGVDLFKKAVNSNT